MADQPLDLATVRELSAREAPNGFLSIYVDAASGRGEGLRDAAIELKNRLAELERNIAEEGPADRAALLRGTIAELSTDLERLTDPTAPGRGRALFVALGEDEPTRFACQMPLPNRVVYGEDPFIHPLLELLDEGQATGVVIASEAEVVIWEWRLGELEQLEQLIASESLEAPHERSGPVSAASERRSTTPAREQRQARERDRVQQLMRNAAAEAARQASERGWERILISGGERLTDLVATELENGAFALVRDRRNLIGRSRAQLEAEVTEVLVADHREREARLVQELAEAAGAGKATLGLSDVLGALNEGRVRHLIYDPHVRYTGSVGSDGRLYPAGEMPPGGAQTAEETRLTERLVERALATDARVSPVEGAAERLAEAEGIGALLRW